MRRAVFMALIAALLHSATIRTTAQSINPYPRAVLEERVVTRWDCLEAAPWRAVHDCEIASKDGRLVVTSTGSDPYLYAPRVSGDATGTLVVRLRAKSAAGSGGQFFWIHDEDPHWNEAKSRRFAMQTDGDFHDYEVDLDVDGRLRHLRFDPGTEEGIVEIERMGLYQKVLHPLEITKVDAGDETIRVTIANHDGQAHEAQLVVGGSNERVQVDIPAGGQTVADWNDNFTGRSRVALVQVTAEGLPPIERTLCVVRGWTAPPGPSEDFIISEDAAWIIRGGKAVAVVYPLACDLDRTVPKLQIAEDAENRVRLAGEGLELTLGFTDDELRYQLEADRPMIGPTVRVFDELEQGLLAGVEYLGKGETSSSTLDLEGPEHVRFRPDPMHITMPLAAYVTQEATVALSWDDMAVQPIFATPNFFDGTPDHLMALEGKQIDAVLRIGDGWGRRQIDADSPGVLEEAILWAVERRGLPPIPKAPRSPEEQDALCLAAIVGPIQNENGWCHALVPGNPDRFPHHYYADCASAVWRLSGRVPDVPRLVCGGGHLHDDSSFFLTGNAMKWRNVSAWKAASIRARQQSDGSFRYNGEYRKGHFEDTASGWCGQAAWQLLRHAQQTGDAESLAAGLKAVDFLNTFRTPRGAQVWELSLHTPDIMASAWCCAANVMAHEMTGREPYLDHARRWAVTGLPFVYQWGRDDLKIMPYSTIAVYGATNYRAPVWIGLPVQWCGLRYADSILALAPYDDTLDWRAIALGILRTGQQMQYPDGPSIGTLPDVFVLESQSRRPADINPCALINLERRIRGEPGGLVLADDGDHRVLAPFPATLEGGRVRVDAQRGLQYQVIIDGRRIETIDSQGVDWIEVE